MYFSEGLDLLKQSDCVCEDRTGPPGGLRGNHFQSVLHFKVIGRTMRGFLWEYEYIE